MKPLRIAPFVLLLLIGCIKQDEKSMKEASFFTLDSLFRIQLELPIEMDTFFTWEDVDDFHCANERRYRFQNSRFPSNAEAGFTYNIWPDSSYRVSITHVEDYRCWIHNGQEPHPENTISLTRRAAMFKREFELYTFGMQEIYEKQYEVFTCRTILDDRQKYASEYLHAFTVVDSLHFKIEYECAARNCEGFLLKAEASLRSLKIIQLKAKPRRERE